MSRQFLVIAVAAGQYADPAVIGNGQLLNLIVNPLGFLTEIRRALQYNRLSMLTAHRLQAVRIKQVHPLREGISKPVKGRI